MVVIAAIVLVAGLAALTLVGAVVGLVWEFLCRADCACLRGGIGGRRGRVVAHRARGTGDRWKVKAANPAR